MVSPASDRQSKIPTVKKTTDQVKIIFNNVTIAETGRPLMVREEGFPVVYYIPKDDIKMEYFEKSDRRTHCPWKGDAEYYDIEVNGKKARNVAWMYPQPKRRFLLGHEHLAFYPGKMDACYLNERKIKLPEDNINFTGWIVDENNA